MPNQEQWTASVSDIDARAEIVALVLMIIVTTMTIAAPVAEAQTFTVLHSFVGTDGWYPYDGLTIDRAGNLYGTTNFGGNESGNCYPYGCGTVFRLGHRGSGWILSELYNFKGGTDGNGPSSRAVFGPNGTLYGTTLAGGSGGVGVVFNLQPPASACKSVSCPWTESVLFSFQSGVPLEASGDLSFDASGNIYGTTFYGGNYGSCQSEGCGTLYQLTQSGGVWTENVLHAFTGAADGEHPGNGVILDGYGNLYGTAQGDPNNGDSGLIFQFTDSGGSWTESVLYHFLGTQQGAFPYAGLMFDPAGDLIGPTVAGGYYGGGTVYELSPSGDNWQFHSLYNLDIGGADYPYGPLGALVMDGDGNLYGATGTDGAYGYGAVFQLRPSGSGWIYRSLYDFTGGSDGSFPLNVVMDGSGNLYGITRFGGHSGCEAGCGVIFEITP